MVDPWRNRAQLHGDRGHEFVPVGRSERVLHLGQIDEEDVAKMPADRKKKAVPGTSFTTPEKIAKHDSVKDEFGQRVREFLMKMAPGSLNRLSNTNHQQISRSMWESISPMFRL
jgi:hypothetical protein